MTATYFQVAYDGQNAQAFVIDTSVELTWAGGGRGHIITDTVPAISSDGQLTVALIAGPVPSDNDVLTQANGPNTTANAFGDGAEILYPGYFREDVAVAGSGAITWTGPAEGVTHTVFFTETTGPVAGEIITFSGGQTAECITDVAVGQMDVRMISTVDSLPGDTDTFTGETAASGTVLGVVHDRAFTPLHLHRLLSDLNDDEDIQASGDDLSRIDPTASDRSTDQIITLLGTVAINDQVARHMYGGSITQESGDTLYSGLDVQVTSPNAETVPLVIQYDETTGTEDFFNSASDPYWANGFNGDPVAGGVRIMIKTRTNGVDIDGRRVRGALLEYGDFYFFGGTTLGTASTALALFASTDGNNTTGQVTVNGYTSSWTFGFQSLDYNNGNGATPFWAQLDPTPQSKAETYEWTKNYQRRDVLNTNTIYTRNAGLILGVNRDFSYDGRTGALFVEGNEVAWGTLIEYSGLSGTFQVGESVTFTGSGARGRILLENTTTDELVVEVTSGTPLITDTVDSDGTAATAAVDTVTIGSISGTGLILAEDDTAGSGELYYQALYGTNPIDNTPLYSNNTTTFVQAAVAGTVNTRTINNQQVGGFTGADFQTNFGIGLDPNDAQVNDQLRNLLDVVQSPPNNQTGQVTDLVIGDTVTVYPWDGAATDVNGDAEPDFNEMTVNTLVASGSTTIVVNAIPANTPTAGFLRVERDSDANYQLLEYVSWTGATFTLGGSTPTAGIDAAVSNNVFRALVDTVADATTESYTAVYTSANSVAITVRRGGLNPLKTFKTTASFGSGGFSVGAVRTSDA